MPNVESVLPTFNLISAIAAFVLAKFARLGTSKLALTTLF